VGVATGLAEAVAPLGETEGGAERHAVGEWQGLGVAEGGGEALPVRDTHAEAHAEGERLPEWLGGGEGVAEGVGAAPVGEGDPEGTGVPLGAAPDGEGEALPVAHTVALAQSVGEEEDEPLGSPRVGLSVGDREGVAEALRAPLPLPRADAEPLEVGAGERDSRAEAEPLREAEGEGEGEGEREDDCVLRGDTEAAALAVLNPPPSPPPAVCDGEALGVPVGAPLALALREGEAVEEGVRVPSGHCAPAAPVPPPFAVRLFSGVAE